jgi:hypothetical protein
VAWGRFGCSHASHGRRDARQPRRDAADDRLPAAGEAGVRQFLDIGTGLPTSPNMHEIAQRIAPESRVVYVDNDRCKSGCAHARWTDQAA